MTNRAARVAALLVVGGISLAGCGGGNDDFAEIEPAPEAPVEPAPPAAPAAAVDFSELVREQFAMATPDTSEPVPVDETDLEFNDQDDPEAFDDLLDEI